MVQMVLSCSALFFSLVFHFISCVAVVRNNFIRHLNFGNHFFHCIRYENHTRYTSFPPKIDKLNMFGFFLLPLWILETHSMKHSWWWSMPNVHTWIDKVNWNNNATRQPEKSNISCLFPCCALARVKLNCWLYALRDSNRCRLNNCTSYHVEWWCPFGLPNQKKKKTKSFPAHAIAMGQWANWLNLLFIARMPFTPRFDVSRCN